MLLLLSPTKSRRTNMKIEVKIDFIIQENKNNSV